jgi:hypothetical protein
MKVHKHQTGLIQIIPLVLLGLIAITTVVVVTSIQNQNQDIRQHAKEVESPTGDGPYATPKTDNRIVQLPSDTPPEAAVTTTATTPKTTTATEPAICSEASSVGCVGKFPEHLFWADTVTCMKCVRTGKSGPCGRSTASGCSAQNPTDKAKQKEILCADGGKENDCQLRGSKWQVCKAGYWSTPSAGQCDAAKKNYADKQKAQQDTKACDDGGIGGECRQRGFAGWQICKNGLWSAPTQGECNKACSKNTTKCSSDGKQVEVCKPDGTDYFTLTCTDGCDPKTNSCRTSIATSCLDDGSIRTLNSSPCCSTQTHSDAQYRVICGPPSNVSAECQGKKAGDCGTNGYGCVVKGDLLLAAGSACSPSTQQTQVKYTIQNDTCIACTSDTSCTLTVGECTKALTTHQKTCWSLDTNTKTCAQITTDTSTVCSYNTHTECDDALNKAKGIIGGFFTDVQKTVTTITEVATSLLSPKKCTPDAKECTGNVFRICRSNGSGYATTVTCSAGCDTTTNTCKTTSVSSSVSPPPVGESTIVDCATDDDCNKGQKCLVSFGSKRCIRTVSTPSDTKPKACSTSNPCPSGQFCNPTPYGYFCGKTQVVPTTAPDTCKIGETKCSADGKLSRQCIRENGTWTGTSCSNGCDTYTGLCHSVYEGGTTDINMCLLNGGRCVMRVISCNSKLFGGGICGEGYECGIGCKDPGSTTKPLNPCITNGIVTKTPSACCSEVAIDIGKRLYRCGPETTTATTGKESTCLEDSDCKDQANGKCLAKKCVYPVTTETDTTISCEQTCGGLSSNTEIFNSCTNGCCISRCAASDTACIAKCNGSVAPLPESQKTCWSYDTKQKICTQISTDSSTICTYNTKTECDDALKKAKGLIGSFFSNVQQTVTTVAGTVTSILSPKKCQNVCKNDTLQACNSSGGYDTIHCSEGCAEDNISCKITSVAPAPSFAPANSSLPTKSCNSFGKKECDSTAYCSWDSTRCMPKMTVDSRCRCNATVDGKATPFSVGDQITSTDKKLYLCVQHQEGSCSFEVKSDATTSFIPAENITSTDPDINKVINLAKSVQTACGITVTIDMQNPYIPTKTLNALLETCQKVPKSITSATQNITLTSKNLAYVLVPQNTGTVLAGGGGNVDVILSQVIANTNTKKTADGKSVMDGFSEASKKDGLAYEWDFLGFQQPCSIQGKDIFGYQGTYVKDTHAYTEAATAYVLNPQALKDAEPTVYEFLKQNVFEGKEFTQ